ncbi:formimidoylglutamate deiminase [Undibacterium sp.]|uniref:formimidoylglutamate deiminase n=1 Tax=Undibacterium sp. TaxID=1914977 RepID=UPI00374D05DC
MATNPTNTLFARYALLPQGWTRDVRISWDQQGNFSSVEAGATALAYEVPQSFVLPGMVNLHSHSFQRALAGMTETAGEGPDSFWTWRDLMYRTALNITPTQIQAIAAQLYVECLRHGYTSVCEFHYLHRARDGSLYADIAETARRVLAAAQASGMGITMLPVLYSHADFGDVPLRHDQRRFATGNEDLLRIAAALESERGGQVEVGVAPHSLRGANTQQIRELLTALPAHRPIHIHIAEQQREVDACVAMTGKRPVELLFDTQHVDARWCLVHATHLSPGELRMMAASGAVAGICTTTEGNLGDGFFDLSGYLALGGSFGVGSDSHVSQSPVEELRWLEYGQRLRTQQRNIAQLAGQRRVGDFLWKSALAGGAQASGRDVGRLAVGARADMLVLDDRHPNLSGLPVEDVLNTWIFTGNDNLVRDVYVGGQQLVENGRHKNQDAIAADYAVTMAALRALSA